MNRQWGGMLLGKRKRRNCEARFNIKMLVAAAGESSPESQVNWTIISRRERTETSAGRIPNRKEALQGRKPNGLALPGASLDTLGALSADAPLGRGRLGTQEVPGGGRGASTRSLKIRLYAGVGFSHLAGTVKYREGRIGFDLRMGHCRNV